MLPTKLTAKQAETLYFIKAFVKAEGYPPTLVEIAAEHGVTLNASASRIKQLVEKGAITRKPNHSRSIRPTPRFKFIVKESKNVGI